MFSGFYEDTYLSTTVSLKLMSPDPQLWPEKEEKEVVKKMDKVLYPCCDCHANKTESRNGFPILRPLMKMTNPPKPRASGFIKSAKSIKE